MRYAYRQTNHCKLFPEGVRAFVLRPLFRAHFVDGTEYDLGARGFAICCGIHASDLRIAQRIEFLSQYDSAQRQYVLSVGFGIIPERSLFQVMRNVYSSMCETCIPASIVMIFSRTF